MYLRVAIRLRAAFGNFLLHQNSSLITVTFGDKVLILAKSTALILNFDSNHVNISVFLQQFCLHTNMPYLKTAITSVCIRHLVTLIILAMQNIV